MIHYFSSSSWLIIESGFVICIHESVENIVIFIPEINLAIYAFPFYNVNLPWPMNSYCKMGMVTSLCDIWKIFLKCHLLRQK